MDGFGLNYRYYSFGAANRISIQKNNIFSYGTSLKYNGNVIKKGTNTGNNQLFIFKISFADNRFYKGALYALEIYDRDLTDEEIAKVKARMIAEYEEKTGNKYEEETV